MDVRARRDVSYSRTSLAGAPASLELHLSGPDHTASFKLVTPSGETIKPVALKAASTSADETEYAGEFELPHEPFRVVAKGKDGKGNADQRFYAGLFHAETVEVTRLGDPFDDLPPGQTTPVRFTVHTAVELPHRGCRQQAIRQSRRA